jgi:predicted enzyme related to lactoylglutathione lyase
MERGVRYTAMIVGFLLATLTAVGAAEPDRPDFVEFTVHDLVKSKTFYGAVFGWTFAEPGPTSPSKMQVARSGWRADGRL